MPIDAGILELVSILQFMGIPTIASCQGHLDHGLPSPWIDISVEQSSHYVSLAQEYNQLAKQLSAKTDAGSQADYERLKQIRQQLSQATQKAIQPLVTALKSFYQQHQSPYLAHITIKPHGPALRLISQGYIFYQEASPTQKERYLKQAQQEFKDLTEYLKPAYLQNE